MPKTFQDSFNKLVIERVDDVACVKAENAPEYKENKKEISRLFTELKQILGDKFKLLLELESAMSTSACITTYYAYRQGLKDSVLLRTEMGMEHPEKLVG